MIIIKVEMLQWFEDNTRYVGKMLHSVFSFSSISSLRRKVSISLVLEMICWGLGSEIETEISRKEDL